MQLACRRSCGPEGMEPPGEVMELHPPRRWLWLLCRPMVQPRWDGVVFCPLLHFPSSGVAPFDGLGSSHSAPPSVSTSPCSGSAPTCDSVATLLISETYTSPNSPDSHIGDVT